MAYLEDYNEIITDGGYKIITNSRIRQYLSIDRYLLIRTGSKKGDPNSEIESNSNVYCYDEYGKLIWQWENNYIIDIRIKNNKLILYDPSDMGYTYEVNVKTGEKLKINIVR